MTVLRREDVQSKLASWDRSPYRTVRSPILAIVLWGLFRAPKAVFRVDPFVKALIEILVMGTAAFAWADMHQWIVFGIFTLAAVSTGLIVNRREF